MRPKGEEQGKFKASDERFTICVVEDDRDSCEGKIGSKAERDGANEQVGDD